MEGYEALGAVVVTSDADASAQSAARNAEPRGYDPRRIVRNLQAAAVGEAVVRGTSFLATIIVARTLSASDFGRFSFVVAVVSVGILISDVGLQVASTRAIAIDRARAAAYVTSVLILGGVCALLSYTVIVGSGLLGLLPFGVTKAAAIFGLVLFLAVGTNAWGSHLRGFERQDLIYVALAVSAIVLLGGVVFVARGGPSVETLLTVWVVSFALRVVLILVFLAARVQRPRWHLDRGVLRATAVAAPAVAAAYILQGAYSHLDVVLLGFLVTAKNVGEYAAAYRLVDGVTFVTAGAATAAVFPVFARLAKEHPAEVPRLYGVVSRFMTAALAPLALLLVALAQPLVELVFGRDNDETVRLFALLAPSTLLIALNFTAAFVALAIGRTREAIICTGAAAAVNVAANLVGVPLIGTEAATVATLLAEVVMLALFQVTLARRLTGANVARAAAVAVALASTAVAAVAVAGDARVAVGLIGAVVALPLLAVTRSFDPGDADRLRRVVAVAMSLRRRP